MPTATQTTQKTDSIKIVKHDSVFIYIRDSIYVKVGGDTVFLERYKTLFRDRWHCDTLIRTDSIYIDDKTTEIKEINKLKWYQTALMWMGVVMTAAMIVIILIKR